jgi:peptidoglycan/LPS O-acetylase OafA/YrhL
MSTWFVLAAALCIALASLTYRWIERPFLVRKARLDTSEPSRSGHVQKPRTSRI